MKFKMFRLSVCIFFEAILISIPANATPPGMVGEGRGCRRYHIENICDGSYYACVENYKQQTSQFNSSLVSLRQEQAVIPSRINYCMGELLTLSKFESDRRSDRMQSHTKVEGLKETIDQFKNLVNNQELFFQSLEEEINILGKAIPEIAIRLNNLVVKQNTKIESIIDDLKSRLVLTEDFDEMERVNLDIEIFKKLKISQSRFSPNDSLGFNNLINQALFGKGDEKLKAMSFFDPLTYLVLKTTLGTVFNSDSNGPVALENQIQLIRNDMNNFRQKLASDLALEVQKSYQDARSYQDASNNCLYKENECGELEKRNQSLPQLINQAEANVSGSNSMLVECNRFCRSVKVDDCP